MNSQTRCWFCRRLILPEDETDRHHIIPRRYFRVRANGDNPSNIARVHIGCHRRFHFEYDQPQIRDAAAFGEYMETVNWGKGVFEQTFAARTGQISRATA